MRDSGNRHLVRKSWVCTGWRPIGAPGTESNDHSNRRLSGRGRCGL